MTSLKELHEKLLTANQVLHYDNVVDAYGHISVRHPSGSSAPAVVSSPDDLIQYHVSNSSPVNPTAKKGYPERFIHGEMYKNFPGVNCVIHSHVQTVMPCVTSGMPLITVCFMAGFLGEVVPVLDISPLNSPNDRQDLLVNGSRYGEELAHRFITSKLPKPQIQLKSSSASPSPTNAVVLMRHYSFTTQAADIETAIYRAIYTAVNAGIQMQAALLRNVYTAAPGIRWMKTEMNFEFVPRTARQGEGPKETNKGKRRRGLGD